jgi:very-short-patch-repair endonuclease
MYILDFYCTEKRLCIEIDWDSHYTEEWKWYDEVRTEYLNLAWIKVIRFTNIDIKTNIEWVLEVVKKELWI